MKRGTTLIAIIVMLGGLAVAWLGGFFSRSEPVGPLPEFDPTPEQITYASAADRTQGLYEVQYWLVQKGPWPNPALLQDFARFYWKETPDIEAVKEVVRVPAFKTRRGYVICDECPVFVTVIRHPVREDVEEAEPEKEPLPERPKKTPPIGG